MARPQLSGLALLLMAASCGQPNNETIEEYGDGMSAETEPELIPLTLDEEIGSGRYEPPYHGTGEGDTRFDPECNITAEQIAGIPIATTVGEFQASFPTSAAMNYGTLREGLWALCAFRNSWAAICGHFVDEGPFERTANNAVILDPEIELEAIEVRAPQCRTEEGIGPGSTIEAAEAVYGDAAFIFGPAPDNLEYVEFENGPPGMIFHAEARQPFRYEPGWPSGRSAGDYSDSVAEEGERVETTQFRPGAAIRSVWVNRPR